MSMSTAITYQKNKFVVKDPYSALTHFIGIIVSGIISPVIMMEAFRKESDNISLISIAVFTISMILLYTASTIYHTFYINEHVSLMFKKIDHCMISVLIAGTYTPVCLISLRNDGGIKLLILVWGLACIGVLFKLCWVTCPRWISSIIYIGMGWLCLFAFPALYRTLSHAAFAWLLFGGIVYTAGGVVYALKLSEFNERNMNFGSHEIFHVCVLVGNLAHFICIFLSLN